LTSHRCYCFKCSLIFTACKIWFSVDIQKFRSSKQKILCEPEKKEFCPEKVLENCTLYKSKGWWFLLVNFGIWKDMERKKKERCEGFLQKVEEKTLRQLEASVLRNKTNQAPQKWGCESMCTS